MRLVDTPWIVPLLQAQMEGKTIQFLSGSGVWRDAGDCISFTAGKDCYRIKPEPPQYRLFKRAGFYPIGIVTRNRADCPDAIAIQVEEGVASGTHEWVTDWLDLPNT